MKLPSALGTSVLIAGWLAACGTPPPEPPAQTAEVIYVTATHNPATAAALPSQTPLPGFSAAPTPRGPTFSREIFFATEPDVTHAERSFARRTAQVYAMWRYSGMSNGLRVHREWLQNGELYVERDTDWDFEKYGASGLLSDTSIFDHANGLPPGHYELRLWIAGEPQFSDEDAPFRSFDLGIATTYPSLSPDGKYNLVVENQSTLAVKDGSGRRRELARADGIAGYDWLPDSLNVVYSTYTNNPAYDLEQHELWLINVEGGAAEPLSEPGENFQQPLVSPDGGRIALLAADEKCDERLSIVVLELDRATLKRARLITLADINGLVGPNGEKVAYAAGESPGVWKSPSRLEAELVWTCAENSSDAQTIWLDMIGLTAEKPAAP